MTSASVFVTSMLPTAGTCRLSKIFRWGKDGAGERGARCCVDDVKVGAILTAAPGPCLMGTTGGNLVVDVCSDCSISEGLERRKTKSRFGLSSLAAGWGGGSTLLVGVTVAWFAMRPAATK